MEINVGDVVLMKKAHPCGSSEWKILRTGMDFRAKCCGCGHEILVPRKKFEKNIKKIVENQKRA